MNLFELDDLPVDFQLYESIQRGNAPLWNVKAQVGRTWKSRIRSRGGFWMAECELDETPDTQEEWFQEGLMREVHALVGGQSVWEGFIADMELRRHGESFHRWWGDIRNRVKLYYTRIAPNQFTNGSAETGAWTALLTPTTLEQSTTWKTHGLYSCHIITDHATEGATIQTGITIVASKQYDCKVQVKIISGTWCLRIRRVDTGGVLGDTTQIGPAQCTMTVTISEDNTIARNLAVDLFTTSNAGETYADEASFREGSVSAETSYYEDIDSQADYGVIEEALLEAGMSDEAANAKAWTTMRELAWPRAKPPNEGRASGKDGLSVVLYGHVYTLRNKFTLATGPDPASTLINTILSESAYITAGIIETNSMQYQIDDRGPARGWEVARDVTLAGDASGNRWNCGVYAGRKLDYKLAENALIGHWRGGELWNIAGGMLEAWYALPGNVYMDDMPIGPADLTGLMADDPRVVFIEEMEFDAGAWLKDGRGLKFRREAQNE